MDNRNAILFVSEPAKDSDKKGFTLKYDAETMELLEIIDDQPFCKVNRQGDRFNTKYIPNYEDLQHDVQIFGGGGPDA